MRKIVCYDVVEASTAARLAELVNDRIDNDWEPLGGVATCTSSDMACVYHSQALAMYEEEEPV